MVSIQENPYARKYKDMTGFQDPQLNSCGPNFSKKSELQ